MVNDYFILDIALPVDEVQTELTGFISRYEKEILTLCLGYDLYSTFITALSGTPDQKWTDLRDGKVYQVNGVNVKWNGLVNTDKISLIAYYVYYKFLVSSSEFASSNGVKLINNENAANINPRQKQVYAYNQCLDLIGSPSDSVKKGTLYNFLTYSNGLNSLTYPNWEFTQLTKINIFNI